MSTDYANFAAAREFATEFSCKVNINPNLYFQPKLHLIQTANTFHTIGMLRMGWTI